MALRSEPAVTVPITGPRSRAVAAPQRMGKRPGVPAPGCEVSRIWPLRLVVMASRVLAAPQNAKGPSPTKPNERPPNEDLFWGETGPFARGSRTSAVDSAVLFGLAGANSAHAPRGLARRVAGACSGSSGHGWRG